MSLANPFDFPEDDLLFELVALYFERINLYLPLFYRPLFQQSIIDGLHRKDASFALLVLLVCAVGSKFSGNPRTYLDPDKPHSSGWKWFNQATDAHKAFLSLVTLYDVQFYPVRSLE